MAMVEPMSRLHLRLPPSCVHYWPIDDSYALIGTYSLEETHSTSTDTGTTENSKLAQKRVGSLDILRVSDHKLSCVQSHPVDCAILDLRFSPFDAQVVCVATSVSLLYLYSLSTSPRQFLGEKADGEQLRLQHISSYRACEHDALVLSIAWHPTSPNVIAGTLSTGQVYLYTLPHAKDSSGPPDVIRPLDKILVLSSPLEVWSVAFNETGSGIFCGADDAALRYQEISDVDSQQPSIGVPRTDRLDHRQGWTDSRSHTAGVTAILPLKEKLIVTGSYDEKLRLFEEQVSGRMKLLAEHDLGGGVWKLDFVPRATTVEDLRTSTASHFTLLASCMHAGPKLVSVRWKKPGLWQIDSGASLPGHGSMNYGCAIKQDLSGNSLSIISTSFYDRLVCLWRYNQTVDLLEQ